MNSIFIIIGCDRTLLYYYVYIYLYNLLASELIVDEVIFYVDVYVEKRDSCAFNTVCMEYCIR